MANLQDVEHMVNEIARIACSHQGREWATRLVTGYGEIGAIIYSGSWASGEWDENGGSIDYVDLRDGMSLDDILDFVSRLLTDYRAEAEDLQIRVPVAA